MLPCISTVSPLYLPYSAPSLPITSRDHISISPRQDIYSVNCIAFHPTYGTFATTGSDGTFNFWDKDSRQRLKAFGKASHPVPVGAFNRDGTIFGCAASGSGDDPAAAAMAARAHWPSLISLFAHLASLCAS